MIQRRVTFLRALNLILGIVLLSHPVSTYADSGPWTTEFWGTFTFEHRKFTDRPAYVGRESNESSFSSRFTLYFEDENYRSFTLTPHLRYDAADSERNLADLQEAYFLLFGDIGENEWELRLGFDKVFWGVVESRNLVDIVNQTDVAAHPDEKSKLGQLMAHLTLTSDWGVMELFALPFHRLRTYPGVGGRFRTAWVFDNDRVIYESTASEWNFDVAARYSNSVGSVEFGVSTFYGTAREPSIRFVPGQPFLFPYYEVIRQYGLDGQITTGPFLFKLETINRSGSSNRLIQKEDFTAYILGAEYSLYSLFGSELDMTLFTEYIYDQRKDRATHEFNDDVFLSTRFAFNDAASTELTTSILSSTDNDSQTLALKFSRRISDQWVMDIEGLSILKTKESDLLYPIKEDSYIGFKINYSF